MDYLSGLGYRFTSLQGERSTADPHGLAITFDDGYKHLSTVLPDMIERFGIEPVVFMPTAWIGKPNRWDYSYRLRSVPHLDGNDVRQLASCGVRFGSHGHRHLDLTRCSAAELAAELSDSRRRLEDILGERVSTVSYPYGRHNRRVRDAAAVAGYHLGFTMRFPTPGDLPLAVGRLSVYTWDSRLAVLQKISGGPLAGLERLKSRLANSLSAGSDILNRMRRHGSI